ncbi:MAG TPA: DinB family protein [Thermoanaerobaculia bacterium]|nr:DinB family protein [Thermoanaerobaculia bacterium]
MNRPDPSEYAPYYETYVSLIKSDDIESVLRAQLTDMKSLIGSAVGDKETFRYAPEKWSVRQLVGHVTDSERIFGYRALALGRGETAALPAFDETLYMANSPFAGITLTEIWSELESLRQANILMVHKFRPEDWARVGVANNNRASTRAITYVLAGHAQHHMNVLKERYLSS